jgi:Cysteine-rich secretory protein family
MRVLNGLVFAAAATALIACGSSSNGSGSGGSNGTGGGNGSGGSSNGNDAYASARQACVNAINQYRATLKLTPYTRWTSAESCVDGQAKADSISGTPHSAFGHCGEMAQNECPDWPSVSSITSGNPSCLAQMWAEGPGSDFSTHGHYINMSSTSYTMVACGFYTTPGGKVWATQDFR